MGRQKINEEIPNLDLQIDDHKVSFVCKTMEEIEGTRGVTMAAEGPHRHNYFTVIWVESGSGKHFIDFKEYPIVPGTIFFISPGQVHHIELDTPPRGYVILFTEDFLQENGIPLDFMNGLRLFFACDEVKAIHPDAESAGRLKGYVTQMFAEFHADDALRNEGISAWLKLFFIECKRIKGEEFPPMPPIITSQNRIIAEFKQGVENHYQKLHKVSEYADMLHITSNYLNEVVKSETGLSAKEVIQNRLILEAKRLAIYSEISSKEVAYRLGFDDPAHFSKFFKNLTGESFSVHKEKMRLHTA